MKIFDADILADLAGVKVSANLTSVFEGLKTRGEAEGLLNPHRLSQYLAQLAHESMDFRYDREVWDGKGAQARYDTRTDLGNTPERDGDGFKYRGRTAIQITGKYNTRVFGEWVRSFDPDAPDFVKDPDAMNTDPWEGLGPIWYWSTRNLNRYADEGNAEMITKLINGGFNGLGDRLENYTEISLRMLGHDRKGVSAFQKSALLEIDGIAGPKTRAALHEALVALPAYTLTQATVAAPQHQEPVLAPATKELPTEAVLALAKIRRIVADYEALL